jgi:hypothetical protein
MSTHITTNRGTQTAAEMYTDGTYLKYNETWHLEDSPWKASQITNILQKNNINPSRVCEVGCGAGEILKQLSKTFPDAHFVGYELSPQAFELCKTRQSRRVSYHQKDINQDDDLYDCLLCIDVFEHVEDYIGFIKRLRAKATYKIFHIPLDISVVSVLRSSMMRERQIVGHLHYFTRETALATLTDCGYEIVDSFYTTSFLDLTPMRSNTLRTKFALFRYRLLFRMFPNLTVRLHGGCSLIVLTK